MKFLFLITLVSLVSCNFFGPKRNPSSVEEEIVSTREKLTFNLSFSDIKYGFQQAVKNSPIIEKVNHFYMDPVTRIFSVNLTVNYPMSKILDFTAVPEQDRPSDYHDIELSFRFSKTKNLAISRYLGLELTKFKIDGDDYLDQFDIVLASVQTILANSELTDYLLVQNRDMLPNDDMVAIVREIFESKTIKVFAETRKINIKLDLAKFNSISPIMSQVQDLRLWRFSPSIYETRNNAEGVSFLIVVGEGRPHPQWLASQQAIIKDDTRTLLQVREDLYREYSNIDNVMSDVNSYLQQLLKGESIQRERLPGRYQQELARLMQNIELRARKTLSRANDHFTASPEYEYLQFTTEQKTELRNFVADLNRKLTIDENILRGGLKDSKKKPLVTKRFSQNLLNKAMNFLVDVELEEEKLFSEFNMWLQPNKAGIVLQTIVHLPLKFILSNMEKGFLDSKFESKLTGPKEGFPCELYMSMRMGDNGKLGLDIEQLNVKANGKTHTFKRTNKNHKFLIEFAKTYAAKMLAPIKLNREDEIDSERQRKKEIKQLLKYLSELKSAYGENGLDIEKVMATDLKINPFNTSGKEYVLRKTEILLGDLINYNEATQLFEVHIDPRVVFENINNVKNRLQVWGITPVKSEELNNTFLEVAMGEGLRSSQFISDMYHRSGVAENTQFSSIYYELGRERSSVDLLFSVHLNYLTPYINNFLKDMVKVNSIDIEAQAKANPGETFYEIGHVDFNVTAKKQLQLNFQLKMANYSRSITSWFSRKLTVDTYSFSTVVELKAKKVELSNKNLMDLIYYPQALSVIPKKVRINSGKPSLFNKAMMKILNSAIRIGLNNGTVKKLILKMLGKMTDKMYTENKGPILGHELEKFARIKTTSNDILIFLNPKLAGAAFNAHLAGDEAPEKEAIKLSMEDQTMHFAFTAGSMMAKTDKIELLSIYREMNDFLKPFEAAKDKKEFLNLINGQDFAQKLVKNRDRSKRSFYNRFIYTMSKYDPVLHVTKLSNQVNFSDEIRLQRNRGDITSASERTRISPSGAELIYFASIGKFMQQNLARIAKKYQSFGLDQGSQAKNYGYVYIKDALAILEKNVNGPLLERYRNKHHQINQVILNNKASYWTYLVYPNAYFSNEVYQLIK